MRSAIPRPPAGYVRRPLAVATVGVAASLVTAGLTQAFVVAAVAVHLVDALPGIVLTLSIKYLGSASQALGLLTALAMVMGAYGLAGTVGVRLSRAFDDPFGGGLATATLAWAVTALATGFPLTALGAALPMGAVLAVMEFSGGRDASIAQDRRRLFRAMVGAAGLAGLGGVLGASELDGIGAGSDAGRRPLSTGERGEARSRIETARERNLDVDGLPSLVSPVEEFYEVDINPVDPRVGVDDWSLSITGAVETERTYSYDDVRSRATEHRLSTLRCVGESLNGHKLDTALWTGVPIEGLLAEAGPVEESCCVMLRAADDYYEEFPLAALRPGFLAYGMNGRLLPKSHGYPLRALVPGHWGEVSVKWLTEIEVLDEEATGYWEERGWHGTGPVNTVAKLWVTNRQGGRMEVAGHAFAGTRGIERVEVSTDGGDTWTAASLSEPLPGTDVWRQWAHRYEHPGESHRVVVRAVDGTGAVQPQERREAFPSGPTGWVSKTIEQ